MNKVALIHDQLTVYRGAERVLDVLHNMYPDAPIYTTVYIKDKFPSTYFNLDIRTSFINYLPIIRQTHRLRAPLFPIGIQTFKFKDLDFIISDTQGISKGIKLQKGIYHASYVHTPSWALWGIKDVKGRTFTKFLGRKWDFKTAQNPNILVANSETTRARIKLFYNRESIVVYPPVEVEQLRYDSKESKNKKDYIVFVGGLEGYKGELELAQACTELRQKVIFIGKGKNELILKEYSPYVELLNNVNDTQKAILIKEAKALFNGSIEDFGINMAEAISLGTPVIAIGKGGAKEIIDEYKTGIFVNSLAINDIKQKIIEINSITFDTNYLQIQGEKFNRAVFIGKMQEIIAKRLCV